jgi:hypothetical protein
LEGNDEEKSGEVRAMLLADTHLLGSRKGHWFDKLRRYIKLCSSFINPFLSMYSIPSSRASL